MNKNKFKIVVCNLGYENIFIDRLDGKEFETLEEAIQEIKEEIPEDTKKIDSFEITKINYDVTEKDAKDYSIDIIDTTDINRGIYIEIL